MLAAPRFEHALEAGKLPPLHADPFDRMPVARVTRRF
jgi:PIN domain nuclease of toxin-antitoxin system